MDDQKIEDQEMEDQKVDGQKMNGPQIEDHWKMEDKRLDDEKDEKIEKSAFKDDSGAEKLPTDDRPETLPIHQHLYGRHPNPELAVTIRELLLRQSLNLPLSTLIYYILPHLQTAKVWKFHCAKLCIAAGVASLVVDLPIYLRLRMASEKPEFYYGGFGLVPRKGWPHMTKEDWNPRRTTHSAKLRYIFPLAIVAVVYLLAFGVFIVVDAPRELSSFDGFKFCRRPSLPVRKAMICYPFVGLLYALMFAFAVPFFNAFRDQARICYNCLEEREWFAELNRDILDITTKEESELL